MNKTLFVLAAVLGLAVVTAKAQKASAIRQIDFENFIFAWGDPPDSVPENWEWVTSLPDQHFRAIDGIHHFYSRTQDESDRQNSPLVSVDSVTYGDLDGDGIEEAVVALNYSTGGTANWDYLYIYKLQGGRPKLLARMQSGSRASGGVIRVFVQGNFLVVDFNDVEKRVGECCSEGYIRVRYRWRDGSFVEEGQREYGKIDLQEGSSRLRFRNYRVRNIYHGVPATPVITKDFRGFRTRIRWGAKSGVEFAGHYTIPRWGCGTECNGFVIVDSISGRIYEGLGIVGLPFDWVQERGGDDAIPRMEFYPNSRLLKINACPHEKDCGLYDYEMIDGKGLTLLHFEPIPEEFQP